jgi:hypothetical protein
MPIHVGEMTSDVNAFDSDLPLSEAQIEKLVEIILRRLERKQREKELDREATTIRRSSAPPLPIGS